MEFKHQEIEEKWKRKWQEDQTYKVDNDYSKPKYYVLDMFPYPSGAGLHVGHPLGYIASDIVARKKKMKGFNVLHPMGFDAFGLPAEQYAIQTGIHPAISTQENIERYRKQLINIGLNFDWSREVITCDPKYYKWTQWIFLKLYSHYYNTKENKAKPISELISLFEKSGNQNADAANNQDSIFTANEWNAKTPKQQDEVLMNYRLAYRKTSYVNWCEALGTVLANDEIKDGVSERGGYPVEKRPMLQWALRITTYAERLLNDLDKLEWSDALKNMQKNWIGKSKGAKLFFKIEGHSDQLEIFTTRPDTIFGATFMVLAPEHPFVQKITTKEQRKEIDSYLDYTSKRSERDRQTDVKTITGAFTGAYAIHPFTGNKIPVWISDYVLIEYGSGAIMAVPCNDKRDQHFAKHFHLPIINVVDQSDFPNSDLEDQVGKMINSDFLNGMGVKEAIDYIINIIKVMEMGNELIQYRMRDANFSRQRYWGEPFPIYYDSEGVSHPLDETELPLELPHIEQIEPGKGGHSPLFAATDWVNWNGNTRETDTMPGYAGSSWYFLRYMDVINENEFASKDALKYWQDVDLYIGGTEHAVGHLMYSRFWHKFLYDLDFVPTIEPFKKLVNQGMITAKGYYCDYLHYKANDGSTCHMFGNSEEIKSDLLNIDSEKFEYIGPGEESRLPYIGNYLDEYNRITLSKFYEYYKEIIFPNPVYHVDSASSFVWINDDAGVEYFTVRVCEEKMSKSRFNIVNPDDIILKYGADCFRMYEMFLGPIEQSKPWDTKGIDGVFKFLRKYHSMFFNEADEFILSNEAASPEELKILHTCIKKANEDIENLSFNTSVSAFMICVNELRRLSCNKKSVLIPFTQLLAPFAPFITEEIWQLAGESGSIHHSSYPIHSEEYLISDTVNYPVSINGKKRHEWIVAKSLSQDELQKQVMELEEIRKYIENQDIKKIIIVPGRMINIVI